MSKPAAVSAMPLKEPIHRITDISSLIAEHAESLNLSLRRQSEKLFPPSAKKPLRLFQSGEVAHFLGVQSDRLRNLSLEGKGPQPTVTHTKRRLYSLEQMHELRAYLDANGRTTEPFLPHRQSGEHLQVIAV